MRRFVRPLMIAALFGFAIGIPEVLPRRAVAGLFGHGGQGVATVAAVPVQAQYVTATPVAAILVYVTRAPLFQWRPRLMMANTVAAPVATTSLVTTSSPVVATSYVVQMPATVTTAAATVPQVSVTQSGQTLTFTVSGTPATNQPVVSDTVTASQAPYLTRFSFGGNTVATLIKTILKGMMQSLGSNATNKDLLTQIAMFLLNNAFGGFSFDLNQATPDIQKIIDALLNEFRGNGGGTGTLPPGSYPFQGTISGTITVGPNGNVNPQPTPIPIPPNNQGASDPSDRGSSSSSPF